VLAVVPVKGREGAKSRLAPLLPPEERMRLVLEMLERVLRACAAASAIEETLLVTPDPSVAPPGVAVLVDAGTGHADAVAAALADGRARGGVVVVMADCPLVRPESLDALAEAARPFALAPARDGGVNAIALRDPSAFAPRFGVSAEEMAAAARAAGIEPAVVADPGLALDVDRPEDLAFA
jgi:2-phospho-L-lactate guanylyltransferase